MGIPNPRIKLLPDNLINQIAAGEVIERPASVVKELLDNSLDAGATNLSIDIERGGTSLIRIRDNGHGIEKDDLAMALTRHATSKIQTLKDLQCIMSLGFRGEALPSMASISRLILTSRASDTELGWTIKAEGRSEHSDIEPASHPQGTTIEICDLFFNTPARRKYLRSERTEFYQIQQLLRHFAIANPTLALKLNHNGKTALNLKAVSTENIEARLSAIFGKKFLQNLVRVAQPSGNMNLSGWLGLSGTFRTINDSQFFCLNGRCIRDKRINHAIKQAYNDLLPAGRYPAFVLNLEIDPSQIDVNVHPAKTEVRFLETRTIHDFVYSVLHQALQPGLDSVIPFQAPSTGSKNNNLSHYTTPSGKANFRRAVTSRSLPSQKKIQENTEFYQTGRKTLSVATTETNGEKGQHNTFKIGNALLIKHKGEVIVVDLEGIKPILIQQQLKTEQNVPCKPLLFPLEISENKTTLIQQRDLLAEFGFDLKSNETNQLLLRQIPRFLPLILDLTQLLKEIAECFKSRSHDHRKSLTLCLSKYVETVTGEMIESCVASGIDLSRTVKQLDERELLEIIRQP